jgi:hypothetical protein
MTVNISLFQCFGKKPFRDAFLHGDYMPSRSQGKPVAFILDLSKNPGTFILANQVNFTFADNLNMGRVT